MVQLQSVIAKQYKTVRTSIQIKVQTAVYALSHASRKIKLVFGSAFALAFLIAPAAALMLSGSPSNSLSADGTATDPGTPASNTDSQADSQSPATSSDNSDSNTSAGSNTSVNVNNDTTTVSVNGQTVVGPTTAPVSKTINSNGTQTTVNVQSSSSGGGSNNSFTHVNSFTHTESSQ